MLLSAADVEQQRFSVTRWLGYDVRSVDRLLDQVTATLRTWSAACQQAAEARDAGRLDALSQHPRVLSAETLRAVRLPRARWREAYDIAAVDAFVRDVEETLHSCEREWARLTHR